MNGTIAKFGWPRTLVREYAHWVVLLRPAQPTLGSLVLAAKSQETAFGALPAEAFAELQRVTADLEVALGTFAAFEKINYLMLMMVDPHVHFHVIPRYSGQRDFAGTSFVDAGWPKAPALGEAVELNAGEQADIVAVLRNHWPRDAGAAGLV